MNGQVEALGAERKPCEMGEEIRRPRRDLKDAQVDREILKKAGFFAIAEVNIR